MSPSMSVCVCLLQIETGAQKTVQQESGTVIIDVMLYLNICDSEIQRRCFVYAA